MRAVLLSICLFACLFALTSVAAADEVLGPAEYLKIVAESKLQYNIGSKPARMPVDLPACPRRDESMRVVQRGGEKKLAPWPMNPEIIGPLSEGRKLFQAEKFEEAAAKYAAALEKDPEFAPAWLFYGDTFLMGAKDPAAALKQYQKAIALDPTLPRPHFFASTAYVQLGRKSDAREEIVRALAYNPSYEAVWKVALDNPEFWGIRPVVRRRFEPPPGYLGTKGPNGIDIFAGENNEWLGYALCKAVWANEERFRKGHSANGWSLEEEHACVLNQLIGVYNATEAKLEKQARTPVTEKAVAAAMPPREAHIFDAAGAHLLDAYILFEIIGRNCPMMLSTMNDQARQQVEAYIRKYIIVAAE